MQEYESTQQAKAAFKRLAKSVCVLSCYDGGQRHASIATAVSNVSNEPPSLLICVEKTASFGALINTNKRFAVNVLGAEQQAVVDNCMQEKGEQRFAVGDWQQASDELPYLADAQASFLCRAVEVTAFETHHIVIAYIEKALCAERPSALVYTAGQFIALDALTK